MLRLLLVVLLMLHTTPLLADQWWGWTTLDMYRKPPWTGGVFLGNFADEVNGSWAQIVSPRVKYAAAPWMEFGLGLSMLRIENIARKTYYGQLRPELEINPRCDLTQHLRLEWRNRMEWRENEGQAFTTNRSRHRFQAAYTLPRPLGPLTRVFASNEWLMDLHLRQHTENRFVPLGLTFKINQATDLDVEYMIDSTRANAEWKNVSVLVTYLRVRF